MNQRLAAAALLVLFGAASAAAQTTPDPMNPDRPGLSNGASTVGPHRLQLEVGGNALWDASAPGLYTLPITLRYGLGRAFEVRLESDTLTLQGDDHGVGDLFVGAKWTFHAGDPTLGVMAHVRLPTGTAAFREPRVTPDVTLLANVPLGSRWSIEANVAVDVPKDDAADATIVQWIYAATVGFQLTPRLQAFAELGNVGADVKGGPRQTLADAGLAYAVHDDLVLDVDVIVGLSSAAPDWGLTTGLSVRF